MKEENNDFLSKVFDNKLQSNVETNNLVNNNIDEIFDFLKEIEQKDTSVVKIDTFDYTAPDDAEYVLIDTIILKKVLDLLSTIIDLNSTKAVSRGISIRCVDESNIDIICPNPIHYFKTTEIATNTLSVETNIFMEYLFLTKIAKFLPPKILIYSKDDYSNGYAITKYYIRLTTGDLELVNTNLIQEEIKKLDISYNVLDTPLSIIDSKEAYRKLDSILKLLPKEADTKRRLINIRDGVLTFNSALICAQTELDLPNMIIDTKTGNYIKNACKYSDELKFYPTDDENIDRYAVISGNTIMITYLKAPIDHSMVIERLANINYTSKLDYSDTKYNLDFVTSIIYAIGNIRLKRKDDLLIGTFSLSNGSESTISLKIDGYLGIPNDKSIRVNTKTLLSSLMTLNSTLEPSISYEDGILFLLNSDVKIALITI